ncbi:hypothetical protein MAUB1S_02959 [Mycolicibacterium aubagnense]
MTPAIRKSRPAHDGSDFPTMVLTGTTTYDFTPSEAEGATNVSTNRAA